ncbi:glutaredoxin domain-containing cysteine-rich protein 1 [Clarias gariepinus]|uniref:glutaredoxin domain-containing cysteine-rich protein 1 n=1 Tax=Clarias gariepinus TaxID=13013 RepID=UPI00234C8D49|nr:glutaredoxin domain-containing cysteine-rich protein 1 [Clarias gariepinus]
METLRRVQESGAERRVRFRVASARSGRVLREVFREGEESTEDSADSDTAAGSETERAASPAISEANGHLIGLAVEQHPGDRGSEPDDLLVYASAAHEQLFSRKRVNIFSKNGTIRGVRDKVSAGQVLFNNLSKLYGARETMSVKKLPAGV